MTDRGTEFVGVASEQTRPEPNRSRAATALFVVGLMTVVANSTLYFFGVDSFSHPAVSVLALSLLVPLYLQER
ncbi:hypothetical protein [Halorussus sp. MSC15.2]|uniref:hypothetical protein n=1 Tax=Halorussus sp. MSC15.2 TaxID=2283638 RepID=UPI0013D79E4E|nr:hypothetical protein [Halorussus sp. MSC15.2]NEU55955.1 hypothetical protein [Halorussus sp. MSC15.2]